MNVILLENITQVSMHMILELSFYSTCTTLGCLPRRQQINWRSCQDQTHVTYVTNEILLNFIKQNVRDINRTKFIKKIELSQNLI